MAEDKKGRKSTTVEFDDCVKDVWNELTTQYGVKVGVSMAFMALSRIDPGKQALLLREYKQLAKKRKVGILAEAVSDSAAAEESADRQKHSRGRQTSKG